MRSGAGSFRVGGSGLGGLLRDHFDLDESVFGESGHGYGGAGGGYDAFGGKVFGVDLVHGGEVGHVLEEDGGLYDVNEVEAGFAEDGFEVFEHAGGLFGDAAGDEHAGGRVQSDLAGG